MATIPQLQTENLDNITNQVLPQSITPLIDGAERNKVLLELRDRGVIQLATTGDLATQASTNTKLVLVASVGLFVFETTGTPDGVTVFAAAGTGVWVKKISSTEVLELLLAGKEDVANKNVADGYAGLDGSGKVLSSLLPSYVDDVLEYPDFASLPVTGETGKIYVTIDDNNQYRWTGSVYVSIASGPGVAGLNDLTDVVITTPSIGQVLKWDGTNWINDTDAGGAGSLSGLSDVDVTGLAVGDVLKWDGTNWVASDDDDSEVGAAAPLSGGYAAAAGTVAAGNTIEEAIEKVDGNIALVQTQVAAIQVGNNLFNYYNFR